MWTLAGLLALVLLIPALLYVPVIQDFVKDIAVKEVSKATGMDIAIDKLRLRWPLRLSVDGVSVVEAPGDTMLTAGRMDVGVSILPLLKGEVNVNYARLDSAFYQMGNVDSLMWLRAHLDRFELEASQLKMNMESIDLSRAVVDGARVRLVMRPDTAPAPVDTAASRPMLIRARDIELNRVVYSMSMAPLIDTLGATVPRARLRDGVVDLGSHRINARSLSVDSVEAVYLTPPAGADAAAAAQTDSITATDTSAPWTITAGSLRLTARLATYGVKGAKPLPGLDMNMLQVKDVSIAVDSFYNRGTSIIVPLRELKATERCGLTLDASGTFAMDSLLMKADDFKVRTNASELRLQARMGMGDMTSDPDLPLGVRAEGRLGLADVVRVMPSLRPTIAGMPSPGQITLDADIHGTPAALDVERLRVLYPGLLTLDASGRVDNPFNPDRIGGKVRIDGSLRGAGRLKRTLVDARLGNSFNLPQRMSVKGTVDYKPQNVIADLTVTADGGRVAAKGRWNGRSEGYDAHLSAVDFPVDALLPAFGVGSVTAAVDVTGRGYNPLQASTSMDIKADVSRIYYQKEEYRDIALQANVGGGHAEGTLRSANPFADLDMDFTGTIADTGYIWDVEADVRHLNLQAMKLTPDINAGSLQLSSRGSYNPRSKELHGDVVLDNVNWLAGTTHIVTGLTTAEVDMDSTAVNATLRNGDLTALLGARCSLDSLLPRLDATMALVNRQIAARNLDVDSLQQALPPLDLDVSMGPKNAVSEYLAATGTTIGRLGLHAETSPKINMTASLSSLQTGSTAIDSVRFVAVQHGKYLVYNAVVNNAPGTMDEFAHVELKGFVGFDRLAAMLRQRNIAGKEGYNLGFTATMSDSTATLRFVPYNPVIAYKKWTLNPENYISYNLVTRNIAADLSLTENNSSLRLYTTATADTTGHSGHGGVAPAEDIVLQLDNVHIEDWLAISPYAPPVKGDVNANLRLHWDRQDLTGKGTISLQDLFYDRRRVGNFDLDADVSTDPASGLVRADLALMVDSIKTITVTGTLNDSTRRDPFYLDFSMVRFPLRVANPFLPKGTASLRGMLNGRMEITGTPARPSFSGFLSFDTTAVKVDMLGTEYKFDSRRIPVDSNVVRFDNFAITMCNDNPLTVNGTVDLRDLLDIKLDLGLHAANAMLVNSRRASRGADVYGKAYIDLDATVRGNMQFLNIDANAAVLPGTNVTYILDMASTSISTGAVNDMVHFVRFNDTTAIERDDSIKSEMAMILRASLGVRAGSTINVDLSSDGSNRVQLQGEGNLDFSMSPVNPDGRMIGRYTINKGFVRYTPPMMSEKLFEFDPGSYVAFTGDLMNPTLNLHAVDRVKANVTQQGQNSRLVTFDVALGVTNTLQNMNVVFDMSTNDDITVQNELQGMSPEQRANQAMNLLIYNVYTGPGTSANAGLGGNPLYSFLEGQLNSWMANNIRGIDISFGIEEYDRTYEGNTSTATSYSYRVSKTLFNDRFKIVVGGNYTTDPYADENFAENLLNDVSFEYLLNRSGSMYVRIFRHTGYESILEGEVTQTGVGFVVKRRINRLGDLFNFLRPRRRKATAPAAPIHESATEPQTQTRDNENQ